MLLADIARRVTHDVRAIVLALLMPEAALYYGLLMAKVAPDVALIPFAVAMVWSLVRLAESNDQRWWLAAGLFGGLSLLSKFTVVMMLPAVAAFVLVPDWRLRQLRSLYPWLAALMAMIVFSPVLIWNYQHDWASFRFQAVRATSAHEFSLRTVGDYIGLQWGLVGFVLLPVVLSGLASHRLARLSRPRAGCDPALDRGDRSLPLFPLEVVDAAGRRHLADVHVAGRLCGGRHQYRHAAARGMAGLDGQLDDQMGQRRHCYRHCNGGAGVPVLCRRPLEFHRPRRSDRRRSRL